MKRCRAALKLMITAFVGTSLVASAAWAGPLGLLPQQSHGRHHDGKAVRAVGQGISRVADRGGRGKSDTPVLDALRNGARNYVNNYSGNSDHPILDGLRREYYRNNGHSFAYDRGYHDSYHDYEKETAKAYRDATIANAVVNLVGIAVSAAAQPRVAYAQPVAVAPAPVTVVQTAPHGYYRTESVLVTPGHYEDVRVWIPDTRDACGRVIPGYYECHKRWVADVYEYRPVWVEE